MIQDESAASDPKFRDGWLPTHVPRNAPRFGYSKKKVSTSRVVVVVGGHNKLEASNARISIRGRKDQPTNHFNANATQRDAAKGGAKQEHEQRRCVALASWHGRGYAVCTRM